MSTAVGFRFLYDAGYIHREVEDWFNVGIRMSVYYRCWINWQGRNLDYVVEVEVFLSKVFNNHIATHEDEDLPCVYILLLEAHLPTDWISTFDGIVPSHFYGEIAKTDLGCQVLQAKGHFAEFAEFIRQHKEESEDVDIIMKLKSILWAVVIMHIHFL